MVGVGEYVVTGQLSFYHWVESGWVSQLFISEKRWKSTSLEVIYLSVVGYSYSQLLIIGEGRESTFSYASYLSVGRVGGYSFY